MDERGVQFQDLDSDVIGLGSSLQGSLFLIPVSWVCDFRLVVGGEGDGGSPLKNVQA